VQKREGLAKNERSPLKRCLSFERKERTRLDNRLGSQREARHGGISNFGGRGEGEKRKKVVSKRKSKGFAKEVYKAAVRRGLCAPINIHKGD